MFFRDGKDILNVIAESEITQSPLHMLTGDSLLRFLLADIVGLGGDQSDELNAAFHEEVARVFGEGLPGGRREDLCDDFLDRRWAS